MNTSYTVISTSNIDDYKRPSSSSSALLTTTDHEQALIVAANAWLEEYNDTFCYQGENEYEHFSGVLDMLQERPAPGKIVDYFNENKWTIWEPEFIDSPSFEIDIQETETIVEVSSLDTDLIKEILEVTYVE
mgnify:CR=1 FL=1